MPTNIVNGTLTVTITETVQLDDAATGGPFDHGFSVTNELEIAGIDEIVQRLVTVTTSAAGLLSFSDSAHLAPATTLATYLAGHFIKGDVRYVRITNLNDTELVTLTLRNETNDECALQVPPGGSFMLVAETAGVATVIDGATASAANTLADLEDIKAVAATGTVDLEVVVAAA